MNITLLAQACQGGVDSLSTIYTHYQFEKDEDERLNGLFMLNCGWHGAYGDPKTKVLFFERCEEMKKIA